MRSYVAGRRWAHARTVTSDERAWGGMCGYPQIARSGARGIPVLHASRRRRRGHDARAAACLPAGAEEGSGRARGVTRATALDSGQAGDITRKRNHEVHHATTLLKGVVGWSWGGASPSNSRTRTLKRSACARSLAE